jgi:hypothetical protein
MPELSSICRIELASQLSRYGKFQQGLSKNWVALPYETIVSP